VTARKSDSSGALSQLTAPNEHTAPNKHLAPIKHTATINPTRFLMSVSSPPPPPNEPTDRKTVDRLVPELVRRLLESGAKNITPEGIRQALGELKLPKEALGQALAQLEETRSGLYRSVSREVRELLERTSLSEELAKALSLLALEVKMEVRFKPSNMSPPKASHVSTKIKVRKSDNPPSPGQENDE
jgi:hypothetical protein